MSRRKPALEHWKKLYDIAVRIKEASPWQWMEETDIFGVRDPETGMTGFMSIMGSMGEHYAVASYLGSEGLYSFWNMYMKEVPPDLEDFLETPQLQLSFEDRSYLEQEDLRLIKKLGLRFRGRNSWPMFRSYRPGYHPWFLEAGEATFLTHALEQTLVVAHRCREDKSFVHPEGASSPAFPLSGKYLVRTARKTGDTLVWKDKVEVVRPPGPLSLSLSIDAGRVGMLNRLEYGEATIEMDFFLLPARIGPRGERPSIAYMFLMVDASSGTIINTELFEAKPSKTAMYERIPGHVVDQILGLGFIPEVVRVRSELLLSLLGFLSEKLGFELELSPVLENLDPAREALLGKFL